MNYVDGFVTPVRNANQEAYCQHARDTAAIFKEHGALQVVESWGDDVPEGKLTSFPMAVKREDLIPQILEQAGVKAVRAVEREAAIV